MNILFVSRDNISVGISPIVKNQGDSLIDNGVRLNYFAIKGKGLKGYLKAIYGLKKHLKQNEYDIIHAHYSLSAYVASLAGAKPLVVSLMGSDVKSNFFYRWFIIFFNFFFWSKTIVKSVDMKSSLLVKELEVVPNGVDFRKFKLISKIVSLEKTGWDVAKKHILFAANPYRYVKNYKLAKEAFALLSIDGLELHYLDDVVNKDMPYYYNAADVVLLTSLWEGSPNVIKEAMACNTPIVSTDVGDVKDIIGKTNGCYIARGNPIEISLKIQEALKFNGKTTGRENIRHLDSRIIANRIINIYNSILRK